MADLTTTEKKLLDKAADDILRDLHNNSAELGRLAMEASAAAASVNSRNDSLAGQKFLKRFWNNLNGRNRRTQLQINYDNSRALYLSEKILVKMAKMQGMTLSVVQIVHTRLNTFMSETNDAIDDLYMEINEIYSTLTDKFMNYIKGLQSDVDLLMWVNAMQSDNSLAGMNNSSALAKLVYDFYKMFGMKYNGNEFAQLRTAFENRLGKGAMITYRDFIDEVRKTRLADIFRMNKMTLPHNVPVSVGLEDGMDRVFEVTMVNIDMEIPVTDFAIMLLNEIDEIRHSEWEEKMPRIYKEAQSGNPDAQYLIGVFYIEGKWIPVNREKGIQCLRAAESNGSTEAAEYLRRLR